MRSIKSGLIAILAIGLLAGSAVGVAAQEDGAADPMAPAWVMGAIEWAPTCAGQVTATSDEHRTREVGEFCHPQVWTSDDARLGGEAIVAWNRDIYRVDADGQGAMDAFSVFAIVTDVAGEAGGWRCIDASSLEGGSGFFTELLQESSKVSCTGYGSNEGLMAILFLADAVGQQNSFEGLIFPGDLPPLPEATAP